VHALHGYICLFCIPSSLPYMCVNFSFPLQMIYSYPKETTHTEGVWIQRAADNTYSLSNYKLQPTRCNFYWFIYFYRRSTCFRRFLRPSSGAHNCTYILSSASSKVAASSNIGWQYLKLYVQMCAPDDGRRDRLKHVKRL